MPRFRWPFVVMTALYCAGIYHLSSQSDLLTAAPTWLDRPGVDKLAHAVVFGGLAALVHQGLVRSDASVSRRARWVLPLLFTVLYGLSDEIHQRFVPHRTFDLFDLLADTTGAILALALLQAQRRFSRSVSRAATAGRKS